MKTILLDIETNMSEHFRHIWVCVTKCIETKEIKIWKQANGLQDYLKDATRIVAHNAIGFDAYHLNRRWNTRIKLKSIYDTLVVSRLVNPNIEGGHSLEAWGNRLKGKQKVDYAAQWEERKGRKQHYFGECFDDFIYDIGTDYCRTDVEVLEEIYLFLLDEAKQKKFSDESIELEHEVQAIIAEQERNGYLLDVPYSQSLLAEIKMKMSTILDDMQVRFPPVTEERYSEKTGKRLKDNVIVFNPGSRQQIADKLMGLGWKPEKKQRKVLSLLMNRLLRSVIYQKQRCSLSI